MEQGAALPDDAGPAEAAAPQARAGFYKVALSAYGKTSRPTGVFETLWYALRNQRYILGRVEERWDNFGRCGHPLDIFSETSYF